jgi:arylsulfatase
MNAPLVTSLTTLCLLSAQGAYAEEARRPARQPNILIVLADDLGYSDLNCYGGEISTPNIDALAKGGARFTQFYTSARCCPTRASLMTGLYPSQAGIGDFTSARPNAARGPGYLGRLTERCVTLAEALKPAGYGCYYVGKWHMHPETGPIRRGFDEFYGFTNDHSHDQFDKDYYIRLPAGRKKEIDPPASDFYATDVFNNYALEFLRQGQQSGKPWFLFLGHSSPHFPVQAPAARADAFDATYARGWDVLREERFERMKRIGLIEGDRWTLTPRSLVPVDRDDIANGFSGQPNPAWASLDEARRRDLARRMSVFAAMVEGIDQGVGRIIVQLKATGDLDNTLILFLSDNGACYEWGPYGFDGESRRGTTRLHQGEDLRRIGGPGTHHAYGSGWANLSNTPFRLYKHFTHEGGIAAPLIVHWPKGIGVFDRWVREPAHVMDVMPTVLEAAGAQYPLTREGLGLPPPEGRSLLPAIRGERQPERTIGFDHQGAHALRQGDWKLVWGKRMPYDIRWELYNLAEDRCETTDLAGQQPERVKAMAAEWEQWARRVQVIYDKPKKAAASAR